MTRQVGYLFGAAVSAALLSTGASAETRLNYGSYVPSRHVLITQAVVPYLEAVKADTNGSIDYVIHGDGTIVSGRSTLQGIRDGVVEMGTVVDLYVPSDLPHSALLSELALYGEDALAMSGAVNEAQFLNCEGCIKDLADNNVKPLGFYSTTPYHLLCGSEVDGGLDDLAGKRIRGTGPWSGWIDAMGGVPVNITSSEIYEAMERGQLECSVGSISWLTSYGLIDVVKSIIELPMGTYHGANLFNINMDAWDSLTEEERQAMRRHLPEGVKNVTLAYQTEDEEARRKAEAKGIVFVQPSDELLALIEEYRAGEPARVTELASSRGITDFGPTAETFVKLVEKWTGIVDESGHDPARFQQALEENVYSKLKE